MWRNTKNIWSATALILSLMVWTGCQGDKSGPGKTGQEEGLNEDIQETFLQDTETLPAGMKIRVRLSQAISTETNQSGDTFHATLESPLIKNGETLAPAGSRVTGEIPQVKKSGKVKGRAEMQLTLRNIAFDGSEYGLHTHPLTIQAKSSEKRDAAMIAGGTAAGAIIGAITGGGKGAAIGAGIGGGGSTAYVLSTRGEKVEFEAETTFEFTLSEDVELPVQ